MMSPTGRSEPIVRCPGAFTLLELLLVLTVLGIVASVAAARLGGLRTSQGVEQAAYQVAEQARRCQHLAISRAQTVRLRLDPTTLTAGVELLAGSAASAPADGHDATIALHAGAEEMTLGFVRDDRVATPGGRIELLFYPDARCDPAGVVAIACAGRAATVRINAGSRPPQVEASR